MYDHLNPAGSPLYSPPPPEDYGVRVATEREQKDQFFRTSSESPIKKEDLAKFVPLPSNVAPNGYADPGHVSIRLLVPLQRGNTLIWMY